MSLNKKKICGIGVTVDKHKTILEEIKKWLNQSHGAPRVVVTPNPEQVVLAQSEKRFADMLNRADVALPDGIGVSWIAGVRRIPGVEFMEALAEIAAKRSVSVGLIGGKTGVAIKALECLQARYSRLRGWAIEPEGYSVEKIVQKIKKTNTRIVFVGLGAPKQEYFIERISRKMSFPSSIEVEDRLRRESVYFLPENQDRSPIRSGMTHGTIFMSVGGSFDIIAGSLRRAPVLIRSIGFEWAWRLFQEPWRWRRQLALLQFVRLLIKEKMTHR